MSVNKNICEIIQMYILAVIFNETTAFNAQSNVIDNDSNQSNIYKFQLCIDTQCGSDNHTGDFKSFEYINFADINYARNFANSYLFINTLDRLSQVIEESVETPKFTESELIQILNHARIIAYTKADEINCSVSIG